MIIKRIDLFVEGKAFFLERVDDVLQVRDQHGSIDTLTKDANENDCWSIAHTLFILSTGHRGTCGDVRALQMLLSLSLPT